MSSFMTDITTLQQILLRTSPTPIGLSPGFLSNGINLQARSTSRELSLISSLHCFLITFASAERKSLLHSPYTGTLDVKGFLHPSASIPDGPEPPLVICAAFNTRASSMTSYTIGCDSVSSFSGIGKKTALSTLNDNINDLMAILEFGDSV